MRGAAWLSAACVMLHGARADCTVAAVQAPANGALGTACQPFNTLRDGESCAITCHAGYTRSGVQPSCTGGSFNPGSIVCSGNPCLTDPVIPGIASTMSECEELNHGDVCVFHCEDGLRPSGTTTCNAGQYRPATCDEIDACVNFPCNLPESETCTDILAADGGLDSVDGRVCTGNLCDAESDGSLVARGYIAANPSATTVAELGQIECAPGFMRVGDRSVAPTARCLAGDGGNTPMQFEFNGCTNSLCDPINRFPTFLAGFDLDAMGVTLPTRPGVDAPVSGLDTCQVNRLPSGSVSLTVKCNNAGEYEQENPSALDRVCAPCTAVEHAAVEACVYTIPDVPPVGTAPVSPEAAASFIDACASVDMSGSDPEGSCTTAVGGVCTYVPRATYTCTTPTDSRVSACKPGYYKTVGLPDVVETADTVESTNDVCTPCNGVENAARGSIATCTTMHDTRVSACAAEHFRNQGVNERCDGQTEGDATDDACEALALDGEASTCTGATAPASPCSHTAGTSDTCEPCGRIVDALEGVVQNCTNANDTRVESCRRNYVLVKGATGEFPSPDTCWSTPPSVAITYDGNYDDATANPTAFTSFQQRFRRDLSDFLSIPQNRIVLTSVVQGSIVVYFYILGEAASAPLNEFTTDEAYDYLETSAESGKFRVPPLQLGCVASFIVKPRSGFSPHLLTVSLLWVNVGSTVGTLALLFPGASFSKELVMPVDVPRGYRPPPPPPPPVVCSDILDREGCLSKSCGW